MFSFLLLLAASCFCIACSKEILRDYGSSYSFNLPRGAEFLEFTSLLRQDHPTILWNRTNPDTSGGRGKLVRNIWEMRKLTQEDSGYYTFRRKDRRSISMYTLTVQEHSEFQEKMVGETLHIIFPLDSDLCTLSFSPNSEPYTLVLMRAGRIKMLDRFEGRIRKLSNTEPTLALGIEYLETTDSGIYTVKDQNNHLVLSVELEVLEPVPQALYIGVAVGIAFVVILCCCCVRKRCCKSSSKRDNAVIQTAVYQDNTSQPSGPSYCTTTYTPTYPASSSLPPQNTSQPSGRSHSTAPYTPTYPASSSLPPQVAATGGEEAAPSFSLNSDLLSSDHEPQFKMKGMTSTGPLGSDTTFCHVYTSDKLNCL